jgi:hypothetical protein
MFASVDFGSAENSLGRWLTAAHPRGRASA